MSAEGDGERLSHGQQKQVMLTAVVDTKTVLIWARWGFSSLYPFSFKLVMVRTKRERVWQKRNDRLGPVFH